MSYFQKQLIISSYRRCGSSKQQGDKLTYTLYIVFHMIFLCSTVENLEVEIKSIKTACHVQKHAQAQSYGI